MSARLWLAACAVFVLGACTRAELSFVPAESPIPAGSQVDVTLRAYDSLQGGPCDLSTDGILWYTVPAGRFAPLWANRARCRASAVLLSDLPVPLAQWAIPRLPTRTIFAAVSLQDERAIGGMSGIESVASAHHVPVTWLIANASNIALDSGLYEQYHRQNGDDVQTRLNPDTITAAAQTFAWFTPSVAVLGAGYERDIGGALPYGAFWGITWNSRGTDRTYDQGAPWGTYCADVHSYKRPDPRGNCSLLSIEWTARDLTRAYYSGREDAFSTIPEDLLDRAGFTPQSASGYIRAMVDAYAAAGQDQPLVMVAEEESSNFNRGADAGVLDALYGQAEADGMKRLTFRDLTPVARSFSNRARAVAFPYIEAGNPALMPARIVGGTIDFHDDAVGMTFEAGKSTPTRVFPYARTPFSRFNVELARLQPQEMPELTLAAVSNGSLIVRVRSPVATPYGIAVWSDSRRLGLAGSGVVPAGSAGAVLRFDVPQGTSDHMFACAACASGAFDYAQ